MFDAAGPSGRDYGDSILKLRLQGNRLVVSDFFTPSNEAKLNANDGDLGSGGPLLLPDGPGKGTAGIVFGGKEGVLYEINPVKMGGLQHHSGNPDVESFQLSEGIYSAPAYWNGHLYTYASEDSLKEFAVTNGKIAAACTSRSQQRSMFSGGTPTVSADGDRHGIVWIVETRAWNEGGMRAVLRAYEALNVDKPLYSSDVNGSRDEASTALRFTIPMVANGRVYVGGVKSVTVYGLLQQ